MGKLICCTYPLSLTFQEEIRLVKCYRRVLKGSNEFRAKGIEKMLRRLLVFYNIIIIALAVLFGTEMVSEGWDIGTWYTSSLACSRLRVQSLMLLETLVMR